METGVVVWGAAAVAAVVLVMTTILLVRSLRGEGALVAELRTRAAELEGEAQELRLELDRERAAGVEARTRLDAERAAFEEQRRQLAEAEERLREAFKALSAEALRQNRNEFMNQASERMEGFQQLLKEYQQRLREIEEARSTAYGGLQQHLESLARAHEGLRKEAHTLSTALRSPTVRGRWGEVTLRRVVELAGMSRHCDFAEQTTTATEEGRQRPDMVVKLPNDRIIVVDSKVPLDAYLEATEAAEDETRRGKLRQHARAVRDRVRQLGQKGYASHLETAPDFVVLFLPGESFFAAALEQDPTLIEDGMNNGVVLSTPTTLIALLRAVAYGWQQQELAENARRIANSGRELYDRVRVFAEHLAGVGKGLRSAGDAYNRAVASYQTRLVPGARGLAELGAGSGHELPEVAGTEANLRTVDEPAGPENG